MGRTILPTAEADLLYPRAVDILLEIDKLEEDIKESKNAVTGELVIGASTVPGTYILPQLAATFKKKFPSISFEISIDQTEKIIDSVAANQLYMGMVGAKIPSSKLTYEKYSEDQLLLAAATDFSSAPVISVADLKNLPFIVREKGSGTRKSIELLLHQHNQSIKDLNIIATLGSSAAVKEAVKANLGVSIISQHTIKEELLNGKVKKIDIEGFHFLRSFYLVTPKKRSLPHHYRTFISYISAN